VLDLLAVLLTVSAARLLAHARIVMFAIRKTHQRPPLVHGKVFTA
jgi:hypothetical protein